MLYFEKLFTEILYILKYDLLIKIPNLEIEIEDKIKITSVNKHIKMKGYLVLPRDRTFVKGNGFLYFAKNMRRNIDKQYVKI